MTRTQIATATVEEGVARTAYTIPSDLAAGSHTLYGVYQENDTYVEATGYNTLEVRIPTVTTITNVLASIGETATFTAQIKYNTNQNVDAGTVQFKLGDSNIGTPVNVSNGVATLQYEIPQGTLNGTSIKAIFIETNTYAASEATGIIKIRESTNVTLTNISGNLDTDVTITANITDADGDEITSGSAQLYIDNTLSGSEVSVDNGVATFTYHIADNMVLGGHTIKVSYIQNDDYDPADGTAQLTVRTPTVLSPVNVSANKGSTVPVTVNVKDGNNSPIPEGTIQITVGQGEAVTATVSVSGEATINYEVPQDATGTISFNAVYVENNNYQGSTMSTAGVITIRKGVTVVVDSVKSNIGDNITLSSTITDENSELVPSGTVNYEIE